MSIAVGRDMRSNNGVAKHTFRSMTSLSFFSSASFNCVTSPFAAGASSSFFSAASPSFAAGASEYHRMAGVAAARVMADG